jgi:hypothetical protein
MVRKTIPWDCRIANLQRLTRNYLKGNVNININTQEGKRTFRRTKLKHSREPTSLVSAYAQNYAHQRPWEECRRSRQCKDVISRGGKEAAASYQINTIEIRAPCMQEAGGTRTGGESRTSHEWTKRTRRMARKAIPWDCRIANLQRPKRNFPKKNIKRNTQEGNCTFRSTKLKRSREPTPLVAAYAHPDRTHGRSLSLSNTGGGQEMNKQRLYIRVKGKKAPKNKREGIVAYGQSISD